MGQSIHVALITNIVLFFEIKNENKKLLQLNLNSQSHNSILGGNKLFKFNYNSYIEIFISYSFDNQLERKSPYFVSFLLKIRPSDFKNLFGFKISGN